MNSPVAAGTGTAEWWCCTDSEEDRGQSQNGKSGCGTLGLDLPESLRGISHLMVLDAVNTGLAPGTLLRFEAEEIHILPVSNSVHLLGLSDLMCALNLMDAAPKEVVLLGVQTASTDWGMALTPEVFPAQQTLMQSGLEQLAQWNRE
ncbi:MAG TPA: hydrogenase maturation protease [Terracidiphilus sp.]|nr:hydrogenase maturation protease [Terracidiphilus sp.]